MSDRWLRFWAWGFPGALAAAPWLVDALGIDSRAVVFAPWLAAAAAAWGVARLGRPWPAALGAAEGAGGVLLMIGLAHLGRSGHHASPAPWLLAGVAALVAGVVAHAGLHRRV